MSRLHLFLGIFRHAKDRFTRFVRNKDGSALLYVIALIGVLVILSGAISYTVIFESGNAYWQMYWTEAFYIAEAGIAKTEWEFKNNVSDLTSVLVGSDGIASTSDDGILSFGASEDFGNGNYRVVITDNDDGDGDLYTDTDYIVLATSTGELPVHNMTRTVRAYMQVILPPSLGNVRGVITTAGRVKTSGNLVVDGRDHDASNDTLIPNNGVFGISTVHTFRQRGNSKVGGTASGIDYFPSKPGARKVIETNADWSVQGGFPNTPDEVLTLSQGTLKSIAQSGVNGSQYVNNPNDLVFPLSGVTYVELEEDGHKQPNDGCHCRKCIDKPNCPCNQPQPPGWRDCPSCPRNFKGRRKLNPRRPHDGHKPPNDGCRCRKCIDKPNCPCNQPQPPGWRDCPSCPINWDDDPGNGGGDDDDDKGTIWQPIDFGNSSGILVVHNSSKNAVMKNLNSGIFSGLIITDDIVHIHSTIIGAIVVLTPNPLVGYCIGNGNGDVSYSSEVLATELQNSIGPGVSTKSWLSY